MAKIEIEIRKTGTKEIIKILISTKIEIAKLQTGKIEKNGKL